MTEAYEHLILKYLQGTLSDNERETFEAWMNQSGDNRKIVEDIRSVWQVSGNPKMDIDFGKDQEWSRLQNSLKKEMSKTPVLPINTKSYALRVAAAIAFLAVSSFIIYSIVFHGKEIVHETADQTLSVVLPDGSTVWLNQNSRISYPQDFADSRDVVFDGEGFFEVKPDKEHPFTISAGEVQVEVVGTSFNVKARNNEFTTEVFVVTGKVSLASSEGNIILITPGSTGVFSKDDRRLTSEAEEDLNITAWKDKRLVFKQSPVRDVIRTLKNYFKTDIHIKNEALLNCRFTSEFSDPTLEEVIETLSVALDLQVDHRDSVYSLDGEGCNTQ